MDRGDAFAVSSGPWSLVRGYFSPATLFLLLNMVIGTIALTSRSHRRHRDDDDDSGHQHRHVHDDQPRHHQFADLAPPPPLARTSSVMDRLRSLGLYRFRSGDFPPEYNHHLAAVTDDDGTAAAAAAHSSSVTKQDQAHQYARSRSEPATRPPPACRNSGNKEDHAVVKKSTSGSEVKRLDRAPPQVRRAPRAQAPRAAREDAAAVSVDARADDFINKFRQQLQLQRLNSLLNYKEMLNRGL